MPTDWLAGSSRQLRHADGVLDFDERITVPDNASVFCDAAEKTALARRMHCADHRSNADIAQVLAYGYKVTFHRRRHFAQWVAPRIDAYGLRTHD